MRKDIKIEELLTQLENSFIIYNQIKNVTRVIASIRFEYNIIYNDDSNMY